MAKAATKKPAKSAPKGLPARAPFKGGKKVVEPAPTSNFIEVNETKRPVKAEHTDVQRRFCFDSERRTCLVVSQDNDVTKFIPLETENGLIVCSTSTKQFEARFKTVPNHSLSRGAAIYARYAIEIGASNEVMSFLRNFTPITPQEVAMATNRKNQNEADKTSKQEASKAKAKKQPAAKPEKVAKPKAAAAAVKPSGEKKLTASTMFKELIMEGKLTDDKIFEKVQAKFGLDDSKRNYVKWYRNDLKKKGVKNVPEGK